jgi:threonine dehydratase
MSHLRHLGATGRDRLPVGCGLSIGRFDPGLCGFDNRSHLLDDIRFDRADMLLAALVECASRDALDPHRSAFDRAGAMQASSAVPETQRPVDREQIAGVEPLIRPYVRHTPIITVDSHDFGLDALPLVMKLEFLQHTGSFKPRGAFANLLTRPSPAAGIAAASGGNHGAAVAYAAMRLGIRATIFVPHITSPAKIERIRGYGAELVVAGDRYADALAASEDFVTRTGALAIHAYDQPETMIGQGTVGLEIEGDAPKIDTLLVAVGGGGLIGGIAAWYAGRIRIVAVEPELSPTLHDALAAGRPIDAPAGGIAADSLAPRRVGELMFPIARSFVERSVLVSDEVIRSAQRALWSTLRVVAEPGGAVALAALLSTAYQPARGERIAVLLCGANTAAVDFDRAGG